MRLLNEATLITKCGVSRSTIKNWRRLKGFPKPVQIAGTEKNLWREEEVDRWLSANMKAA